MKSCKSSTKSLKANPTSTCPNQSQPTSPEILQKAAALLQMARMESIRIHNILALTQQTLLQQCQSPCSSAVQESPVLNNDQTLIQDYQSLCQNRAIFRYSELPQDDSEFESEDSDVCSITSESSSPSSFEEEMTLHVVLNSPKAQEDEESEVPSGWKTFDKKSISCDQCGKCFTRRGNLMQHMSIHTGEKPCACKICGKRFRLKQDLTRHEISHSDKKPHECKVCGKSFNRRTTLYHHKKIHTNNDKPFFCTFCDKGFPRNASYKRHMSSHYGENGFKCNICHMEFVEVDNYTDHLKTHKIKPFYCDHCRTGFGRKFDLQKHILKRCPIFRMST